MARTTQRQLAEMFDEVKDLIAAPSRAAARRYYRQQAEFFHKHYRLCLSPDMDGVWTLSAPWGRNRNCRFCVTYLSARDWIEAPEQAASAFVTRFPS